MSLFRRKQRNNCMDTFGEENVITIKPYAPHQNLSPVNYTETKTMSEFKRSFARQVKYFLDNTSPDEYNPTFADSLIVKVKEQAVAELEVQRAEHIRCIERSICSLWKGDEVFYERLLEQYNTEFEKRNAELKKLKAVFQKNTALEENVERSSY